MNADIVLDSNALTRWVDRHRGTMALMESVLRNDGTVFVPTVCLVESLTGSQRDAATHHRLRAAQTVDLDRGLARASATVRAAVDHDDVVDPVVVATAASLDAMIVSSDPDLPRLAATLSQPVRVVDPTG
jgi:rRNA-processing protein FCF1